MTTSEFHRRTHLAVTALRHAIAGMNTVEVCTFLGSVMANFVGPFSDGDWEQIRAQAKQPCSMPDCGCEKLRSQTIEALTPVREDWRDQMRGVGG